jgi:hypothetical protein
MRRLKRQRKQRNSKLMRKEIEKKGIEVVVSNIIKDFELEETEENIEHITNYVKRIAYK